MYKYLHKHLFLAADTNIALRRQITIYETCQIKSTV